MDETGGTKICLLEAVPTFFWGPARITPHSLPSIPVCRLTNWSKNSKKCKKTGIFGYFGEFSLFFRGGLVLDAEKCPNYRKIPKNTEKY